MVYKIALLKSYKANVKHFLKRKIIKGSYLHEVGDMNPEIRTRISGFYYV